MKCKKMLLRLNENKHTQNLFQIIIQIFEKLIDMGLGHENSFNEFISNLQMNKDIYLALWCTLQKPTLFLKRKPCDIHTNSFSIHVARPLWEANTYAQYILNPYVTTIYFTSYLTKIDKFVTKKM
jgi:hypothetical protein